MTESLLYLDPDSPLNLQTQIRQQLVNAILRGAYPVGSRLPSSRKLAEQLGVARNTVVLAYEQLIEEGYLESRQRSGIFVNEHIRENRVGLRETSRTDKRQEARWNKRIRTVIKNRPQFQWPANWQQHPYPFIDGYFDASLYPTAQWREASRMALGTRLINEGTVTEGDADDPVLIEEIRSKMLPRRGITADPDTVNNYEIGIKGTGHNSFWNIDFFYVDWSDIQLNTATDNWAFFAVQNGGKAHTTGIEAEYDWYFGEGWHLNAGYAYVSGKLDENLYSPTDPDQLNPIALDGTRLPGQPRSTFNMTVDNTYELSSGWEWINRVSGYYQSSMENSILPSPSFASTLDGFSLWDFTSTLADDHWAITLFVKNLFNEKGAVGIFKEEYMGTDPAQNYYGNGSKEYIARPRTIGLNVRYNF